MELYDQPYFPEQSLDQAIESQGASVRQTLMQPKIVGGEVKIGSDTSSLEISSQGLFLGASTFNAAPFRVSLSGALVATSATISGSITATAGTIGGWSIGATDLSSGSGSSHVGLDSGGSNPAIYAGSESPSIAPFRVTQAGAVTATSGTIGGWTLAATTLASSATESTAGISLDSTGNIRVGSSAAAHIDIEGSNQRIASSNFTSGSSGAGFSLDTNKLEVGDLRARGVFSSSVFEVGSINAVGGSSFIVKNSGALTATMTVNAEAADATNATGSSGRHIGYLSLDSAAQSFSMTYGGLLSSISTGIKMFGTVTSGQGPAYAYIYAHKGTYGTSSEPTGSALATSDALDISSASTSSYTPFSFTFSGANRINLLPGTYYTVVFYHPAVDTTNFYRVSAELSDVAAGNASVGMKADIDSAYSVLATTDLKYTINVLRYTISVANSTIIEAGDILRIKDSANDEWLRVTSVDSATTGTVVRDIADSYNDNPPAWTSGIAILNYGQSGDGGVLWTASESPSPRVDIFTHAGSPWSTITTRLRLGNLNGFLDYTGDAYGIAIGSTNSYLKYDPTNGLRIKSDASKINVGTAGYVAGAKTSYADTTEGFFLGEDSGEHKFNIGDATEYMKWTGSSLIVVGGFDASSPVALATYTMTNLPVSSVDTGFNPPSATS